MQLDKVMIPIGSMVLAGVGMFYVCGCPPKLKFSFAS